MTNPPFSHLILPHIAEMEPYTPIVPFEVLSRQLGRAAEQIVKLDANENPYGPAAAVRQALATYPFLHIYPDPEQRELLDALSAYIGAPAEQILPGSGADELIDLLCRITVGPGDAIIDCPPTFGMYSFGAGLTGARALQAWRRPDFSVDVERIGELANGQIADCKLASQDGPNLPNCSSSPRPTTRTAACSSGPTWSGCCNCRCW